MDIRIDTA